MNFGQAIEAMKNGYHVARKGWNGKGMYIWIVEGRFLQSNGHLPYQDSICMKTAQNTVCVGWLASQADMLAEDWEVVE